MRLRREVFGGSFQMNTVARLSVSLTIYAAVLALVLTLKPKPLFMSDGSPRKFTVSAADGGTVSMLPFLLLSAILAVFVSILVT
jgi:hypothetical protein